RGGEAYVQKSTMDTFTMSTAAADQVGRTGRSNPFRPIMISITVLFLPGKYPKELLMVPRLLASVTHNLKSPQHLAYSEESNNLSCHNAGCGKLLAIDIPKTAEHARRIQSISHRG